MSEVVNIYTDGTCRSNPGPGGWAAVILTSRDAKVTIRGRDPNSINNRMELTATIKGLQGLNYWVPESRDLPVILHSDSKYLTDAFNQNWLGKWQRNSWSTSTGKPVSNRELWEELLVLTKQRNITWQWVKGHSGNHFNELCDRIATEEAEAAVQQAWARPQETRDDLDEHFGSGVESARHLETRDNFQTGSGENATGVQTAGETGGGYELEPVQAGAMQVLELIFAAVAEAKSFKDLKNQMGRLEKSIDWQLPYGSAQAHVLGEETPPLDESQPGKNEYDDLPF